MKPTCLLVLSSLIAMPSILTAAPQQEAERPQQPLQELIFTEVVYPQELSHENESERCAEGPNVAESRKVQALKAECAALEMRRHVKRDPQV